MKVSLTAAALLLSLITLTHTATAQTCSCKAPDKSCEATVTCPHGCTALCGSQDACYAACGSVEVDKSYARITIKIDNGNSDEISSRLANESGRKIKFIPRRKNVRYSFELNNDPVWNALKFLSKRGMVLVDGTPFYKLEELRHKLLRGAKVSIHFTDMPVINAVAKLAFVTGLPLRVSAGDSEQLLSISLQNVTLRKIVDRISEQTGVTIKRGRRGRG